MLFRTTFRQPVILTVLFAVWVIAIGVGMRILVNYSTTPGRLARPPLNWPAAVPVQHTRGHSSLVVFAHPECPCSRATIGELARIAACCRNQVDSTVLFYIPRGDPMNWSTSDLVRSASAIPGVQVLQDVDGAISRRFGARTSGQTLLYDPLGHLAFNGGITAWRGHAGDNDGRDAVVSLLLGNSPKLNLTPVFGCALFSEE